MSARPTRRAAIGMLAAVPAALLPLEHTVARGTRVASVSPKLLARIKAHDQIAAAKNMWEEATLRPALEALRAATDAVPHHTTHNGFQNIAGSITHMSTANEASVKNARKVIAANSFGSNDGDYRDTLHELIEAADARDAKIHSLEDQAGLSALREQEGRFDEACYAALDAVAKEPVASIADVAAKLDFIAEHDLWGSEDLVLPLVDGTRRLAGGRLA